MGWNNRETFPKEMMFELNSKGRIDFFYMIMFGRLFPVRIKTWFSEKE